MTATTDTIITATTNNETLQYQQSTSRFRLTHVLQAHSSDVRSVATTFDSLSGREALLSGSRDQTATLWSRHYPTSDDSHDASSSSSSSSSSWSTFDKGATFHIERFCNAVSFIQPAPFFGLSRAQVLLGSLDSQIRCFDPLRPDKPLQVLSDHWDNISVLKPYNGIKLNDNEHSVPPVLISASWDKTARVWIWDATRAGGIWICKFVLGGHQQAVWGVQIVQRPCLTILECGKEQEKEKELGGSSTNSGKGRYLTSSADLFIRLFHGDQLYAVYAGHTDVVRSLELLPILPCQVKHDDDDKGICEQATGIPALYPNEQLFASTSNDGTVRIWSLDPRRSPTQGNGGDSLRVLQAYTSLVYDLAAYVDHATQKPRLVSSGEDGTFRVWNWVTAELIQTVAVPVISVWSIAVLPQSQDVVIGCSDSLVRVYTTCVPSTPTTITAVDSNFTGSELSESEEAVQEAKAQEIQQQQQQQPELDSN